MEAGSICINFRLGLQKARGRAGQLKMSKIADGLLLVYAQGRVGMKREGQGKGVIHTCRPSVNFGAELLQNCRGMIKRAGRDALGAVKQTPLLLSPRVQDARRIKWGEGLRAQEIMGTKLIQGMKC